MHRCQLTRQQAYGRSAAARCGTRPWMSVQDCIFFGEQHIFFSYVAGSLVIQSTCGLCSRGLRVRYPLCSLVKGSSPPEAVSATFGTNKGTDEGFSGRKCVFAQGRASRPRTRPLLLRQPSLRDPCGKQEHSEVRHALLAPTLSSAVLPQRRDKHASVPRAPSSVGARRVSGLADALTLAADGDGDEGRREARRGGGGAGAPHPHHPQLAQRQEPREGCADHAVPLPLSSTSSVHACFVSVCMARTRRLRLSRCEDSNNKD